MLGHPLGGGLLWVELASQAEGWEHSREGKDNTRQRWTLEPLWGMFPSHPSQVLEFGNGGGHTIHGFFKGVERLGRSDKSSATDRCEDNQAGAADVV